MSKIQVDPKLFITCRLCLDSMGVYQIDPSVQEQIKCCFDIDVHPFDRLPQLICLECETLLSNFYGKKKLFQEKQNALRSKLQVEQHENAIVVTNSKTNVTELSLGNDSVNSEQTQQETVTSSQSSDIIVKDRKPKTKSKKRPKDATNTSTEKESTQPSKIVEEKTKVKKKLSTSEVLESLGPDYIQRYTCKICNKHFDTKPEIIEHCKEHNRFMSQHTNVFKTQCCVMMKKIDDTPNKTGTMQTVVLEKNKILQNTEGYYYISYHLKQHLSCSDYDDDQVRPKKKHKKIRPIIDDSSEDEFNVPRNKKKRQRFTSRSSTDTVVLDDNDSKLEVKPEEAKVPTPNKNKEMAITECINIDDSSDDSNHCTKLSLNQFDSNNKSTALLSEYKTIQNIISICHGKYMKKLDSLENSDSSTFKTKNSANFESLLKHKILSIGRKIINKQSFNCNGLLRFLDHKNLDIDWKSVKLSEENSHIRILTQMREPSKKNISDEKNDKWKKVTDKITPSSELLPEVASSTQETEEISKCAINKKTSNKKTENNGTTSQLNVVPLNISDGAVLYLNPDLNLSLKNKLLNKNPVPNPKKLPNKKGSGLSAVQPSDQLTALNSVKESPVIVKNTVPAARAPDQLTDNNNTNDTPLTVQEQDNENMCMPIITFTTSLADIGSMDSATASTSTPENNANQPPRIKVKPVSELMPSKIVVNVGEPNTDIPSSVWNTNNTNGITVTPVPSFLGNGNSQLTQMPVRVTSSTPPQLPRMQNNISTSNDSGREELVLNTVEFPNTRTTCPFTYFQNLLQLHSILLLDSLANLSNGFTCLIKFKVHFSDANLSLCPVILSSSLMSYKNRFCMRILGSNKKKINITTMSAKWQWQLLQTFTGDVADKLLENAAKTNREIHYHTNIFISMLKSIQVLN